MTNRFFIDKNIRNAQVARPVSGRVFAWLIVITVAGALLSAGFVISARQHVEAISTGYESEELRRKANQIEEEIRRLDYEYAAATSLPEIERRAKKMGLQQPKAKAENIRRPINKSEPKKKSR
jgi:cell division protein FtsL